MATGTYEYKSDFARRYYGEGKAEGKVEEAVAAILTVLKTRNIDVPDDVCERIMACTDAAQLTEWLERAVTVARATDIFT